MTPVLIVPGIGNSGPSHWQSLWERKYPAVSRVMQRDWDRPDCDAWVDALDASIRASTPCIVVAHSLGCLVVAHWAARSRQILPGVLMVAIPDPSGPNFPAEARGFGAIPTHWRGGPLTIVSSNDDPYSSPAFAERCVGAWGAEHLVLDSAGHINSASGLDDWAFGWTLVDRWRQR
jgi:predicted alpha/beta hydrolase family esterase